MCAVQNLVLGHGTLKPLLRLVAFFTSSIRLSSSFHFVLSSLRSLTIKLQKKANDILAAYDLVSDVELELQLLKVKCDDEFHVWFEETKNLADELCIQVSTPRIASRQTHRSNIPADSPEAYYRRNNYNDTFY